MSGCGRRRSVVLAVKEYRASGQQLLAARGNEHQSFVYFLCVYTPRALAIVARQATRSVDTHNQTKP